MVACGDCGADWEPEGRFRYCPACRGPEAKARRSRERHPDRNHNPNRVPGYKPKACLTCGNDFQPVNSSNRYCSAGCRPKSLSGTRYVKMSAEYQRRWKLDNPERVKVYRSKARAKRRSAEQCELTGQQYRRILVHYNFSCAYCHAFGVPLQQDHVIPLARGGRHAIGNVVPACRPCNASKLDHLLSEWRHGRVRSRRKPPLGGREWLYQLAGQPERIPEGASLACA